MEEEEEEEMVDKIVPVILSALIGIITIAVGIFGESIMGISNTEVTNVLIFGGIIYLCSIIILIYFLIKYK